MLLSKWKEFARRSIGLAGHLLRAAAGHLLREAHEPRAQALQPGPGWPGVRFGEFCTSVSRETPRKTRRFLGGESVFLLHTQKKGQQSKHCGNWTTARGCIPKIETNLARHKSPGPHSLPLLPPPACRSACRFARDPTRCPASKVQSGGSKDRRSKGNPKDTQLSWIWNHLRSNPASTTPSEKLWN